MDFEGEVRMLAERWIQAAVDGELIDVCARGLARDVAKVAKMEREKDAGPTSESDASAQDSGLVPCPICDEPCTGKRHACPYRVEINDDYEKECACCPECTQACADDV